MRLISAKISALWARDPACRLTGQAGRRWSFSMTSRLTTSEASASLITIICGLTAAWMAANNSEFASASSTSAWRMVAGVQSLNDGPAMLRRLMPMPDGTLASEH